MRPSNLNIFFRNISGIKGIGPKTRENFVRLFRKKPEELVFKDLLFHLPHSIIQRSVENNLLLAPDDREIITGLEVEKITERRAGRRLIYNILCSNDSGFLTIVYFNAFKDQIKNLYTVGQKITVAGKLERHSKQGTQMVHPTYVVKGDNDNLIPKIEPVYPLTYGLSNRMLNKTISGILTNTFDLDEWCDKEFLKQNNFSGFGESLQKIHQPGSYEDLDIFAPARKRLAYDEILANQLAIGLSRKSVTKQKGLLISTKNIFLKKLLEILPFELTKGQREITEQVLRDFKSGNRMFRLLQGDVGSGKTAIAFAAMMEAVEAGFQAGFMLPTEILAKQQFEAINEILQNEFFKGRNIKACCLTGSVKKSEKEKIYQKIEAGEYNFIIGTHSLFQEKVNFKNLGFIAIDEQHKFGVKQRIELMDKGSLDGGRIHVLLMSATPIPRTLAMTLYGDLEVSSLTEKPAGRQKIETRTMPLARLEEVVEGLKRAIKEDNRVYWVCPLINPMEVQAGDSEVDENASAEERFASLKKIFGAEIAIVHGQMKTAEKDAAIEKFRSGKVKILVATTVIEVGVNVPEATIIVIENAEKFGLAQLHQLRGRVGRAERKSNCILLYGVKLSANAKQRLQIMKETEDGFRIAEEDLALRGSGDLIGTKQSGFAEFNFAVLPEHRDLLFTANADVKIILNKDPELKTPRGQALRSLLYLFEYDKQVKNLKA